MHKKLVHQFIEWQALALAPICPHVSEFLWMDILGKKDSILKATWPILGNVDEVVIKSSAYLMKAAGEFRSKLKVACLPPKAKKGQAPGKVRILQLLKYIPMYCYQISICSLKPYFLTQKPGQH